MEDIGVQSIRDGLVSLVERMEKKLATRLGVEIDPSSLKVAQARIVNELISIMNAEALSVEALIESYFDLEALSDYVYLRLCKRPDNTWESKHLTMEIVKSWKKENFKPVALSEDGSMFFYFGYGSNLLKERIKISNPSAVFIGSALLPGHELNFCWQSKRWGGGVATIIPNAKSDTWGAVWALKIEDMVSLDDQEGVDIGIYEPLAVKVFLSGSEAIHCRTYRFQNKSEPRSLPSAEYIRVILQGAIKCKLPEAYIKQLKSIEHNPEGSTEDATDELMELVGGRVQESQEEIDYLNHKLQ